MFDKLYRESKLILTEGAIVERLKADYGLSMDKHINHAGLIYRKPEILEELYRQYIDIGRKYDLPIMIMTPTRKVNFESIEKSNYKDPKILSDSCELLSKIRDSYNEYSEKIFIGGLQGCKGDAYSGQKILCKEESYIFHLRQAKLFEHEKVDFLFAGIMPEIQEAIGMATAMAETEIPYIISFMIQHNGKLMDGTFLCDAIEIIDKAVYRKPLCYMANCIHPGNLIQALNHQENIRSMCLKRFKGIQSNASILSPEELNNCGILNRDSFDKLVEKMCVLKREFDLKIYGGCCGTDHKFLDLLARELIRI